MKAIDGTYVIYHTIYTRGETKRTYDKILDTRTGDTDTIPHILDMFKAHSMSDGSMWYAEFKKNLIYICDEVYIDESGNMFYDNEVMYEKMDNGEHITIELWSLYIYPAEPLTKSDKYAILDLFIDKEEEKLDKEMKEHDIYSA